MKLVAVVTPTFNRAYTLETLFESLKKQTSNNFVWIIVDDGSTDNTAELVQKFVKQKKVEIKFVQKKNGGKHTAINVAMQQVTEPLTLIVDSDDQLTNNAIQIVEQKYDKIKHDQSICGMGFLKLYKNNKNVVGKPYTKNAIVDTFVNQRLNCNTFGDKCEVFKTEVLKQFAFPTFKGEKFLSESTVWCKMSGPYKMMFFNVGIYECEYLEDGLSHNVHKTLFANPKGASECYKQMSTKQVKFLKRAKYTIAFAAYSFAAKKSVKQQFREASSKILYLLTFGLGFFVYLHKKFKYKNK